MPIIYRCSRCGHILYVFHRVGQDTIGILSPSAIAKMYQGVCPRCGSKLSSKPNVNVKAYTVTVVES